MSGIMTLMQMTASLMPQEMIIDQLEERIQEYKAAVLDSEKKSAQQGLTTICMMQVFKTFNKDKDLIQVLNDSERIEKMANVFNVNKQ